MALLVVGGICRFAINQRYQGHQVVNLLDMDLNMGVTGDREQAIPDQAKIIAKQWKLDIFPSLANSLTLESVSWVDLDTDHGSTGEFAGDADVPLPVAAAGGPNGQPGNVCILVRKNTTSGRGTKAGRMYVCGGAEEGTDSADPNRIKSSFVTSYNAAFATWKDNVEQNGGGPGPLAYDSHIHVVHVPKIGDPSSSSVTSLIVDPLLATQRRRLRS